jgi:deoxyribonuclease-4
MNKMKIGKIGTHIPKAKGFLTSLRAFYDQEKNMGRPAQIFTGAPRFWRRPKMDEEDISATRSYLELHGLSVFIHSIYLINTCKDPETFQQNAFDCLRWELELGRKIGFKGVVVHCGKSLDMGHETAWNNMLANMKSMLPFIFPECPLLLETSSGQGSEMCWRYEDLCSFYSAFTKEEQSKIRICIDTCHVFAAGHDPLVFIDNWNKDFPESLVLVHFNDSKECCGEKKDRHERPGRGHIGLGGMTQVAKWCFNHNIPMVME